MKYTIIYQPYLQLSKLSKNMISIIKMNDLKCIVGTLYLLSISKQFDSVGVKFLVYEIHQLFRETYPLLSPVQISTA